MTATCAAPTPYLRDGYEIRRQAVDAATIAATRRSLDALIAGLKPGERPEWLVEPHVRAPDWGFWLGLCRHPTLVRNVAEVLGTDELVLLMSHLIVKPAKDGMRINWHQDLTYWPSVKGRDVCTVWLAIDDADLGNGCMQVIPRTQGEALAFEKADDDLLKVRINITAEQAAQAIPVELRAGDASLHDALLIHGSEPNTSDRRRAGYTIRFADPKRVRIDLAKHGKPVFYVHGDGRNCEPGMIDLRPDLPIPERKVWEAER